jgi:hypothetical protein
VIGVLCLQRQVGNAKEEGGSGSLLCWQGSGARDCTLNPQLSLTYKHWGTCRSMYKEVEMLELEIKERLGENKEKSVKKQRNDK